MNQHSDIVRLSIVSSTIFWLYLVLFSILFIANFLDFFFSLFEWAREQRIKFPFAFILLKLSRFHLQIDDQPPNSEQWENTYTIYICYHPGFLLGKNVVAMQLLLFNIWIFCSKTNLQTSIAFIMQTIIMITFNVMILLNGIWYFNDDVIETACRLNLLKVKLNIENAWTHRSINICFINIVGVIQTSSPWFPYPDAWATNKFTIYIPYCETEYIMK